MANKIRVTDIGELMLMLDDDKNIQDGIDISKLYTHSSKVINWKCKNGHTFREKVSVIYRRKNKCFYCTGREIWPGENDLQTLYPELAEEFDVEKNGITPDHISPKDTDTYWWTCKNNHPSFQQSVEHRVHRQTVCPYCAERKAIPGVNDLETLFPEIAKEWDMEKNNGVLPSTVSPYSYNSYYWRCPKGHSYRKKVIKRTTEHNPVDCTKCIKAHSTSFPEQAIFYYAKKCFPDAVNRYKEPFDNGMELDVYIPHWRTGIEYDGKAFHNDEDQHDRERRKYLACKQLGIKLVRIKESGDTWNDTADDIYYVDKKMNDKDLSLFLYSFFRSVFIFSLHSFKAETDEEKFYNHYWGFPTDFNVSRDRPEILEYLVDVEHSFGVQHPKQAAMWCEEENGSLTPFMFTSGSNYPAIWKCPKCGNTWKSPIASIVQRKVKSCRACSMKEAGKKHTKTLTEKNGSLAERSEILLKQWDYEANGNLSPYEIPLTYSSDVSWKCDKCGYKWSSSPVSRVHGDRIYGCPHCVGRVALPGVDDFATLYPELAKEWDYEKNGDMLPSQIKPYTNKKFYWICPICGKSYETYPGSRVNGHGCRDCANAKVGKKNSKPIGQYDDNGLLIKIYPSLKAATQEMQVTHNAIYQAAKNGGKSKGFYWRYIINEDN